MPGTGLFHPHKTPGSQSICELCCIFKLCHEDQVEMTQLSTVIKADGLKGTLPSPWPKKTKALFYKKANKSPFYIEVLNFIKYFITRIYACVVSAHAPLARKPLWRSEETRATTCTVVTSNVSRHVARTQGWALCRGDKCS